MSKIRVGIIGVGNCASALVQGVYYYQNCLVEDVDYTHIAGLMSPKLCGYSIHDIEFSAAFDINATKVDRDLSEAIFAFPNNTFAIYKDVPYLNVPVMRGMTHDGIGKYLKQKIEVAGKGFSSTANISKVLKDTGTDVVVNLMPVGSEMATKWYVEQILDAGCAFVNGIPVFIASSEYWNGRFEDAGVPVIGDDVKSQVGATIVHRVLANLFKDRGVSLDHTYQLNFGGNMDFYNMLERERLESKKISKTQAVTSQYPMNDRDIHVGPSDYVEWLEDRKFCHIKMEGRAFGEVPLNLEMKLEVWDSPNSAGVLVDAIRCAKIAKDRGMAGAIIAPSSYFMKSPPVQFTDSEAKQAVLDFTEH